MRHRRVLAFEVGFAVPSSGCADVSGISREAPKRIYRSLPLPRASGVTGVVGCAMVVAFNAVRPPNDSEPIHSMTANGAIARDRVDFISVELI